MILDSGAVLPSGLFSITERQGADAFNKKFNNFPVRAGFINNRYDITDEKNLSKLFVEYDVVVLEQNDNGGATQLLYKNCIAADGIGGIANFFEFTLQAQSKRVNGADGSVVYGQDGTYVLLACINGQTEAGVIISGLPNPNRKTTIKGKGNHLEGEFNGINLRVVDDGSATITFRGKTDSFGKPIDENQGTTTIGIEVDGSVQIQNKGSLLRFEKGGNIVIKNTGSTTLTSEKDVSLSANKGGVTVSTSGDSLSIATKSALTLDIKDAMNVSAQSNTIKLKGEYSLKAQQITLEAQSLAKIKAPQMVMDGLVFLGGFGGTPSLTMLTQFIGVSAAGPVISNAVGPFSAKVFIL